MPPSYLKDEVGIESEYFLLDKKGNIKEPKLFGFPFDEFGFLVELRTRPHTKTEPLIEELWKLIDAHQAQAKTLGLKLHSFPRLKLTREFVKYLRTKYAWDYLKDTTANINAGTEVSHATGIDNWSGGRTIWGTAGLHVHFSRKRIYPRCSPRSPTISRIQLPITKIVAAMDSKFRRIIFNSSRIQGEYEIKPYGFEYRSLPASAHIALVVDFAFSLFKKTCDRK